MYEDWIGNETLLILAWMGRENDTYGTHHLHLHFNKFKTCFNRLASARQRLVVL